MKLLFFSFLILTSTLSAQKIVANVALSAPRLTESQKNDISQLKSSIESYINGENWINNDYEDIINCRLNIVIQSLSESSGTKKYAAQFVITSTAQESFYDKQFTFIFSQSESISRYGNTSSQIANFLDFYIYMVIAGELDTYSIYGGDEYYAKANELVTLGLNSGQAGWDDREKLFKNYTTPLMLPMRKAKLLIYTSLNFKAENNFVEMRKNTKDLIRELQYAYKASPNNVALKRYFEAYHKKIIDTLDPAQDQDLIKSLLNIDPARREFYLTFVEK